MLLALIAATVAATPVDYRDAANWLCRPGRADACVPDATRAVVGLDGAMRSERVRPARAPKADCFYVYPTASNDPTPNSDMMPGIEEQGQAASQFAAFAQVCRTFAPIYRQVTLTTLHQGAAALAAADWALAYGDVRAAFHDYLARDNDGRPFVLIGHSQGSALLKRLVSDEIDGTPLSRHLLSAILPGTTVLVPKDKDIGGDFKMLPLCRSNRQTACIVTWASYRDTAPPPANGLFGKSSDPAMVAGCTNPAALGGGAAPMDAVVGFPWWSKGFVQYRPPADWSVAGQVVPTRFARIPGLVSGECVSRGAFTTLAIHVGEDRADGVARVLDPAIVGDAAYPEWGLHVMDVHLVQGDLVRLVAAQSRAWRANRAKMTKMTLNAF
jgi:hypothetical protein